MFLKKNINIPFLSELSFVNLYAVQKSEQVKLDFKLSSDDKTLSSLIKKAYFSCIFQSHIREANER